LLEDLIKKKKYPSLSIKKMEDANQDVAEQENLPLLTKEAISMILVQ